VALLFAPPACTADWLPWVDPLGRHWVTVVAKIGMVLVADGTATIGAAPGLFAVDRPHELGGPGEVELPSDRVPFLRRPELLVTGFAFAPPGTKVDALTASVELRGDDTNFEKRVRVVGPFSSAPLTWSRTVSGEENPVGVAVISDACILDVNDPSRPAGFGPLSPDWPARERHAFGRVREALDEQVLRIEAGLDTRHFQAAPPDQWLTSLCGSLRLALRGLCPTRSELETRLPEVNVAAVVETSRRSRPLRLVPDRLVIDATHRRATLAYRAAVRVEPEELERCTVVLATQHMGKTEWADPRDVASARPHVLQSSAFEERRPSSGVRPAERALAATLHAGRTAS
jgi:hypothetical protein